MVEAAYVLALMLAAEKAPEKSPWRPTYEATAAAIAKAANASPVFDGPRGAERTAAVLVSLAWFEGNFHQDAEGDCTKGGVTVACTVAGAVPHSFCTMQINESNFAPRGVTRADVQGSIDACITTGLKIVHTSFTVCRAVPLEHRLAFYAAGGNGCSENPDARKKSAHRMAKALWLFQNTKPSE